MNDVYAFLKNLNYDELVYANDLSKRILNDYPKEDCVNLYIVNDGLINVACFYEVDFEMAKKELSKVVLGKSFHTIHDHPTISMIRCYKSQVAEWMELND